MIQKVYFHRPEYMYEFNPGQSHLGSKYIIKTILVYNFIYKTYRTTLVNAMQHEPMIDHYFTQLTKVNKYISVMQKLVKVTIIYQYLWFIRIRFCQISIFWCITGGAKQIRILQQYKPLYVWQWEWYCRFSLCQFYCKSLSKMINFSIIKLKYFKFICYK